MLVDPDPDPANIAAVADLHDAIYRVIGELSAREQIAVPLHYLSGLTQAETAELFGIVLGAAKTRLHIARGRVAGHAS